MLSDAKAQEEVEKFMHGLIRRNPGETEFHQAVREVAESLMPFILEHKEYQDNAILERLTEPDRIIIFRVYWQDDHGHVRANRGYRVQQSDCLSFDRQNASSRASVTFL
jgi:glutamate dehydrogenase (NADP+)